ncbi:hypothetical protein [Brevundimonas viscosa]|uniref:Uncharacterized protein n=1 Tax=Brevundimonas viscosa TaxID=871741 RepID=A0A1I6PQJ7_9CAUL|nr:hypothetical protein [Brevundimonas viscosa]SFS42471.1 hypothetical protein SAMN05192570_1185 [Brevundimonas viscosa]
MSKTDRAKKRQQKRARYAKPSLPRVVGANDNIATANDNWSPISIRGVQLTDGQALRLANAEAKLASDDLATRRWGHHMLETLDREIDATLRAREAEANLEELRGLEALRGLDIGVSRQPGTAGAPRASRDGLETLLTAGSITSTHHAAGLRYRADYELLDPEKGLTPPPIDQSRKIVRGGDGFAEKRAERELFVRDLEAMIQEEDPSFRGALGRSDVERQGRAVWALREIAGKGSNLLSLSSSGSVRARTSEALMVALDCAAIAYGLE